MNDSSHAKVEEAEGSVCRFCGQAARLIKAHMIPEAFFPTEKTEGEAPFLISNSQDVFPKKARIGVYDQGILCLPCEKRFDRLDNYGTDVLLKRFDEIFKPLERDGRPVVYVGENLDQGLLLRFLIGLLWRASVSSQQFYERVSLGPYENLARSIVEDADGPIPPVFAAVLSAWNATEELKSLTQPLMNPIRERWNGATAYRFYLGRVVAYIKASNQPFSWPLRECALTRQDKLFVVTRNFDSSKDYAVMVHVAKTSRPPRWISSPSSTGAT